MNDLQIGFSEQKKKKEKRVFQEILDTNESWERFFLRRCLKSPETVQVY